MKQNKGFLKRTSVRLLIAVLLVSGLSFWGAPLLTPYFQERIHTFFNEEEDLQSFKTTRQVPADADVGAFLAALLAQKENNPALIQKYHEKVYAKDPENKEIERGLFWTYLLRGEIEKALPFAPKVLASDEAAKKDKLYAEYILIADLIKKEKYQEALDFMRQSQFKSDNEMIFRYMAVWCYAGLGEKENALAVLESIPDQMRANIYTYHRALLYSYFGEKEKAVETYRQISQDQAFSMNTIVSLFDALGFPSEEFPIRKNLAEEYKTVFPDQLFFLRILKDLNNQPIQTPQQIVADFLSMIGYIGFKNEAYIAILYNNIAAYLDPTSNFIKMTQAQFFKMLEMYDEASDVYLTVQPTASFIIREIALNETKLHHPRTALMLYQKLLQKDPENPVLNHEAALNFLVLGEYETALKFLKTAENFYQKEKRYAPLPKLFRLQAFLYHELDKPEQELQLLEEVFELDGENPEVLNDLGYTLIDSGKDISRGLQLAQKAFQKKPADAHILDSVAWGYYKSGQYDQALKYAERVADRLSGSALANAHLGDIYQAVGRYREAESQYRKALTAKQDMSPALEKDLQAKLENLINQ